MDRLRPENYTVGWVCALPIELDAATKMLDEQHPGLPQQADHPNLYTFGRIYNHNVVIVCLPAGQTGTISAAAVVGRLRYQFPSIQHTFMVGVGGGVPGDDLPGDDGPIRLGDVVVSQPRMEYGGVVQYDSGKSTPSGFIRTGFVNSPPTILLNAISKLRANRLAHQANISKTLCSFSHLRDNSGPDILFKQTYTHVGGTECDMCDRDMVTDRMPRSSEEIVVHYGTIASGNQLIRDGVMRDKLSLELGGVLCFEMEAAGFMNTFPGLVIRGICDYADSHKNKKWQPYAAVTAAALAKEVLSILPAHQPITTKETDFESDNPGRFSAISKRPEWYLVQEGAIPYNILEHISDYEPSYTYHSYSREKCPGTATWIVDSKEFLAWKERTSSCLWLTVGSGKTLVTTTVINHMTEAAKKNGDFVAHFFYNHSSKSRLTAAYLFGSYIKQMLEFLDIIEKLCPRNLVNTMKRFYGPKTCHPSCEEIAKMIFIPLANFLTQHVGNATYIVDGLDECEPGERQVVLSTFRQMMQRHDSQRVLVSGREDLHVKDFMADSITLRISNDDNKEDIQKFIEWRLEEKMLERRLTENECVLQDIQRKLNEGANLMILWVRMQIEALWDECSTDNDIRDALKDLPKNLDETYARCLARIDKRQSRFAPRILRWVSAAIEPFKVDQLREALAIDPKTGCLDRNQQPTRQDIVKCCSNLIISSNGRILLAHHSVRQFLDTRLLGGQFFGETFNLNTAQLELGQLCVAHLTSPDYGLALQPYNTGECSQINMGTPTMQTLIEASLPSWTHHFMRKAKPVRMVLPRRVPQPPSATELPPFFQYAKVQWAPLTSSITMDSPHWTKFRTLALEPNLSWRLHPWSPLGESLDSHYMGLLGWAIVNRHLPLLDLLFTLHDRKPKKDIFSVPFFYYNNLPALHLATRTGDIEITRRLLQVCNVNKTDGFGRTGLHHAADTGHLDITLLFIQKQAKLTAQDQLGRTALHFALNNRHDRVAQALIDEGADVNQSDNTGRTALFLASEDGHEMLVRKLVDRGADINVKDKNQQTALFIALDNLRDEADHARAELGTHINMKDALGRTLLWRDDYMGHDAIVKFLLEKGANIEAKDKDGWTLLLSAAKMGYEAVVKMLLEKGADIEAKDKTQDQTPLLWAAKMGYEAVVKMLLEKGADIEAKDKTQGQTPLLWAARMGYEAVVKMLLEKGADIEAKDKTQGQTPLLWAAKMGHEAVVKMLLERGPDIEVKDRHGQTPLSWAAARGRQGLVKMLIEKGADVDTKDKAGTRPLLMATIEGTEAVVEMLIEKGANVDAKDKAGLTPLLWANFGGTEAMVKLLLTKGANINVKDKKGRTPLLWAFKNGNKDINNLLLQNGAGPGA